MYKLTGKGVPFKFRKLIFSSYEKARQTLRKAVRARVKGNFAQWQPTLEYAASYGIGITKVAA